jgi:hypothetical protein
MNNIYDARWFLHRGNLLSKIPCIGRDHTIKFVDNLYRKGAVQVEVSQTQKLTYATNIIEMFIVAENKSKRAVIDEILKSVPSEILEARRNSFRVKWHPVS